MPEGSTRMEEKKENGDSGEGCNPDKGSCDQRGLNLWPSKGA